MEIIGKSLFFCGFLAAVVIQIYIVILAFKFRISAGLFCLLVTPIYIFFSELRQDTKIRFALKVWISSLVMIILSALILSSM